MLSLLRRIINWLCFWRKPEVPEVQKAVGQVFEEAARALTVKAVYVITKKEEANGMLNTRRKPDSGDRFSIAGLADEEFLKNVSVYHNGMLLMNDHVVANVGAIRNDCARWAPKPSCLIFARPIKEGDVIQVVR